MRSNDGEKVKTFESRIERGSNEKSEAMLKVEKTEVTGAASEKDEITTNIDDKKIKKSANGFLAKLKAVKHIEIVAGLLVCAILMLVYAGVSSKPKPQDKGTSANEYSTERQLAEILSTIDGVGNTKILITYKGGSSIEIACKTDKQTNANGTTTETSVPIIITKAGESSPLVLKENPPEIEGVIVVAQGGGDASVRFKITQAICTALKVDSGKIQVYSMK